MRSLRIFFSIVVIAGVVLPNVYGQESDDNVHTFVDVDTQHIYYESIEYLYNFGIVAGNPNGTFTPERTLNRAEFAKLIMQVDGRDVITVETPCFHDVPVNEWFAPYVCAAKEYGYIKGDQGLGEYYRPGDSLNLAEIMSVMRYLFEWEVPEPSDDQAWYDPLFAEALSKNLLSFAADPGTTPTRGQMSDILGRSMAIYDAYENVFTDYSLYDTLLLNAFVMTPEDCFDGEIFDKELSMCVLDCETEEECQMVEEQIAFQIQQIEDEFYGEDAKDYQSIPAGEMEISRAVYKIIGDELEMLELNKVPNAILHIQNTAKHKEVWNWFIRLIPANQRKDFAEYHIYTDGRDGSFAAVRQYDLDPKKWILLMDMEDAYLEDGSFDIKEVTYTLLHEFAHVLTLRQGQVDLDDNLFFLETRGEGDLDRYYTEAEENCLTYFTGEGCSKEKSYIYQFYKKYWENIIEENNEIQMIEDDQQREDALASFYDRYKDRFVTDYAATNVGEDIAESFTAFILQDKPVGESIADEKLRFFYNFEELVQLRTVLRNRL